MNIRELKVLSHELRLFGIHENLECRISQASKDGQTGEELLRLLLEDEKLSRRKRTSKMLETKAKFRRESYLETWDNSFERGVSKTKIRELSNLNFFHEKKNLIITGATGAGKTQLGISIGKAACHNQISVLFTSVNHFLEDMRAQKVSGNFISWRRQIKKNQIIIFDDFGLRSYEHDEAVFLVDLLEDRYQNSVNIFTSQVEEDGWKCLFHDPVIADALIDRVKNPSEKILLIGGSYREKIGKDKG